MSPGSSCRQDFSYSVLPSLNWTSMEIFAWVCLQYWTMAFSHVWRTLVRQPVSQPASVYVRLCQQIRDVITQLGLRLRGCRAGEHHRKRLQAARRMTSLTAPGNSVQPGAIPVIVGNRRPSETSADSTRQPSQSAKVRCCRVSVLTVIITDHHQLFVPCVFTANSK